MFHLRSNINTDLIQHLMSIEGRKGDDSKYIITIKLYRFLDIMKLVDFSQYMMR